MARKRTPLSKEDALAALFTSSWGPGYGVSKPEAHSPDDAMSALFSRGWGHTGAF